MFKKGFDNDLYLKLQSETILARIKDCNSDKLYLEFGGKILFDLHAARVLPGFDPNVKMHLLAKMKDSVDVIMCISAPDIEKKKVRADFGITYDSDVMKTIDDFRAWGISVKAIVITRYDGQPSADAFRTTMESRGMKVYTHKFTKGYPTDVDLIVSEQGYGANPYIETEKPVVVVTGPGPGSGKLATCLSQMYHEHKRGVKAAYAKFETFPIWNLPLNHPVNLAYEAATADMGDVNMIDPFHLEAYGKTTVNYNRDVQAFPVLQAIFETIYGESPYKSPTDMGVNMAGNCIIDDEICREASKQEIIRRYYEALAGLADGTRREEEADKIELLMKQAHIVKEDRKIIAPAMKRAEETGAAACAIELTDGTVITGKTTKLLGPTAAMVINALKTIAGVPHELQIIAPEAIQPIQTLKTTYLGGKNPRLHTDEVLIALSISAATDENAAAAMAALPQLKGCQAHCSVMLSPVDQRLMKKLGVQMTCEPVYENKKIFH